MTISDLDLESQEIEVVGRSSQRLEVEAEEAEPTRDEVRAINFFSGVEDQLYK